MHSVSDRELIKVLVADDDDYVLECYREAFADEEPTSSLRALNALEAELFDPEVAAEDPPKFDVVECHQGDEAIEYAKQAQQLGQPFDVVILDIRMPPGIDGVEAGSRIRKLDPNVQIVFVSGYSEIPMEELQRRVPPPIRLHYFNKPLSFAQLAEDVVSMVRAH
ncbi:MAG: response regulator [Gammaproteobacteria bacterium]|nr:response regulator [Gammaproteobacteria bacterium]